MTKDSVNFGKNEWGQAWTFVIVARQRGWTVSDPENNGFGYPNVEITSKGIDAPDHYAPEG